MAKSFESIKKHLSQLHYFMNDAWLRDCLNYFLTEHPDASAAEIRSLVIHQWLLSDLREINNERGCLPENISRQKFLMLPGNYILQIEKAYDISTSKYKQLEKIRNISNVNLEITDADKYQPMELNGKRMMNLHLCDGVHDVKAVEYKPISTFGKMVAGYKVMIKGPVICRRGIILLEEKNIRMIGGEIESLLIKNATENVLARVLNLTENLDPDIYIMNGNDISQDSSDDNIDIDLEAVTNIEKLNNTMRTLSASHPPENSPETVPIPKMIREGDFVHNELLHCHDNKPYHMSEVVDDTDDEWIGMIDESNLDTLVTPPPSENLDPNPKYDCSSTHDDIGLTKSHNESVRSINTTALLSGKSNIKLSPTNNVRNTDMPITPNSRIKPVTMALMKSQPSLFTQSIESSAEQRMSKSIAANSRITDFMEASDSGKKLSTSSICKYDSIRDVKKIIPTREVVHKTIKATTKTLQKLMKKNNNWFLEGSVTDGKDDINVTFSAEVLEKLIGFSASEFSQRKKMQRTHPKIKDELRQTLRNTESVLIRMNALLELKLIPNITEAQIICITDLP